MVDESIRIVSYRVVTGDTIASIANKLNVDINSILFLNTNLDPNNLIVGETIYIPYQPKELIPQFRFKNRMRHLFLQHLLWTRMMIISEIERLSDKEVIVKRLKRNCSDILDFLNCFYKDDKDVFKHLLKDHIKITLDIIEGIDNEKYSEVKEIEKCWFKNGHKLICELLRINSFLSKKEIDKCIYTHLKFTKAVIIARVNKEHKDDIKLYDKLEENILELADIFSLAITKQFPHRF